jgi:ubiquinone/menaquinone biosynthesis C-methylase UbiE
MSSVHLSPSNSSVPSWFLDLFDGNPFHDDGQEFEVNGVTLALRDGILRAKTIMTKEQEQTEKVFGFKWHKRDTFESDASINMMNQWCNQRYLPATHWLPERREGYTVLDAGCGACYTGLEYFRPILNRVRYIGADISDAVNVAKIRMEEATANAAFLQCDLVCLPLPNGSIDAIFSEGVLHHTNSTQGAILSLAPLLKSGGLFMFYVYRRKGPIREFTDDFIREKMQRMTPEEGWKSLESITKLGKILGDLDVEIDIPERIEFLDIEAGKINLQRFFYWNVLKCFYRPEYSLDEMNHVNFDWYAPKNAFRQSPEEVRAWCGEAGLDIVHEQIEEAGITVVARKR